MSTSGTPRPAVNKISAKAVAGAGEKPDQEAETDTPSTDKAPAKAATARGTGTKTAPRPAGKGGGRPPVRAGGGGKGRRPTTPVKVNQTRNWGPIAMFGAAGLLAVLIIGFAVYSLASRPDPTKWKERAEAIPGIIDYYKTHPDWVSSQEHKNGPLTFPMNPPAGGTHNPMYQNCMGDVYPAEIPKEQATHSLEHGAVWVTYRPDLAQSQIDELKSKVQDKPFMLMSPYPGLDSPISLQAWGYQLKVDNAGDARIDDFIGSLRQNASKEPTAGCSGGITDTGTKPLDLQPAQ